MYPPANVSDYRTIKLSHIESVLRNVERRAPKFTISHPTCCPDDLFYQYAAERGEDEAFKRWGQWSLNPISFDVRFSKDCDGNIVVQLTGEFEECWEDLSFINKVHAFGGQIFREASPLWSSGKGVQMLAMLSLGNFTGMMRDLVELGWYSTNMEISPGTETYGTHRENMMQQIEKMWRWQARRK